MRLKLGDYGLQLLLIFWLVQNHKHLLHNIVKIFLVRAILSGREGFSKSWVLFKILEDIFLRCESIAAHEVIA